MSTIGLHMILPTWSKTLLIFITVVLSVILLASGFFAYTALTNVSTSTQPLIPTKTSVNSTEQKKLITESPQPTPTPGAVLGRTTTILDPNKLFLLINAHRENFNVPKLRANAQLATSAQLKLTDMLEKNYYRHQDTNDQSTWHFIQVAGYQYSKAGENLAFNVGSEWEIFQAWVQSETHNLQMLDRAFTDVGIAIDCSSIQDPGYKCITVAHFGAQ